jgi:hypothetical protein
MLTRKRILLGLCSIAAVVASASGPDDGLEAVSDDTLKDMRGGMEVGNGLVGYFAIDRVVEVDGQVVAKMQIVVSNLDKLSTGGMPNISISGPLAQLVQIMNGSAPGAAGSAAASAAAAALAAKSSDSAPATAAAQVAQAASPAAGAASNPAASATTVAQNASSAAAGAAGATASSPTLASGSSSSIQSTVTMTSNPASAPPSTASASAQSSAAAASAGGSTINRIIPVGNTGQYVVVSNIPNAAAITTAVQNEVRAATISTQTTITASVNSLTVMNSLALANAIQQQVALATGVR